MSHYVHLDIAVRSISYSNVAPHPTPTPPQMWIADFHVYITIYFLFRHLHAGLTTSRDLTLSRESPTPRTRCWSRPRPRRKKREPCRARHGLRFWGYCRHSVGGWWSGTWSSSIPRCSSLCPHAVISLWIRLRLKPILWWGSCELLKNRNILQRLLSPNRSISHIQQCTSSISHSAPFCNRNV